MPYKNKEDQRAHNRAVYDTPEGLQRAAHRKGIERYRYDKAIAYWRFKLVHGRELPDLIIDVSQEMIGRAEVEVRGGLVDSGIRPDEVGEKKVKQ